MTIASTKVQNDLKGLATYGNYTGAANDPARVQVLIDLVQAQGTMTQRGHLDQMSPSAWLQLLAELEALKASVT